jgi:hypothetical protein
VHISVRSFFKQFNSELQTRPLVREGATKQQRRSCLRKISWRRKNWSRVPDGRLIPGRTGRLTVGRKLTSTSTKPFRKVDVMVPLTMHSIQSISYIRSIYLIICFDLTGHHWANSTFTAHFTVVAKLSTIGI